jgi:hypothetical protein
MGPNYELELVTVLPVTEGKETPYDSTPAVVGPTGQSLAWNLPYAVDAKGFIYVGFPRGRRHGDDTRTTHCPPCVQKLSPVGEVVGTVVGGVRYKPGQFPGWEEYLKELRDKKCGFFNLTKLVADADGYLYIFFSEPGYANGCIAVCDPGFEHARLLNLGAEKHAILDVIYSPESGGIVAKDGGSPITGETTSWFVELRRGRIIKQELPPYYCSDDVWNWVLDLNAGNAELWTVDKRISADRRILRSASLHRLMGFELDLRARETSVRCIGHSEKGGWVFDVKLETDKEQSGPARTVLFVGGEGYAGHLIPPFPPASCRDSLIGLDGKYYEFVFVPGKAGLHIFRAMKKSTGEAGSG